MMADPGLDFSIQQTALMGVNDAVPGGCTNI
jgi:hypothetical protein